MYVRVGDLENANAGTLEIERGIVVHGVMTDLDGNPVKKTLVSISPENHNPEMGLESDAKTSEGTRIPVERKVLDRGRLDHYHARQVFQKQWMFFARSTESSHCGAELDPKPKDGLKMSLRTSGGAAALCRQVKIPPNLGKC